ncbi:MAG TPA: SPOR domain-containing protein [Pseudomonadales bacterium]|nr:SPOR domain-containing protein [Pseudomonadales bacterium]
MSNLLDISIHGPQRVRIVEQLVHVCRYSPGLVLLEGDAGKSPVNFLRDMANLLRDELDFALLDNDCCDALGIAAELVSQWYIYQVAEHEQTDAQSVHHYLDLGLQSGRLALIVVERASLLTDEAVSFLVNMMARHSRLTVLFAGLVDPRPLLRKAQQAEVPVCRIDLPDTTSLSQPAQGGASGFDHTFSDDSYELPDDELEDDWHAREDFLAVTQSSIRVNTADSVFGASIRLAASRAWAVETLAGITKGRSAAGIAVLLVGFLVLAVLLVLRVRYSNMGVDNSSGKELAVTSAAVAVDAAANHALVPPSFPVQSVIGSASTSPSANSTSTPVELSQTERPSMPEVREQPPIPVSPTEISSKPAVVKPERIKAEKTANKPEKQWRAKPDNYTVQVAAAHGEVNIRKLEAKLPVGQPHHLYRTVKNGKPWFVLVYGSFSSKQAAVSARDALGADIKKDTTPWVRKQSEIFAQ